MAKGKRSSKKELSLASEKGYLMLSTLFLLVFSGVFLQSIIKISTNNMIQLNQISSAYQAKTALNVSERILKDYILDNPHELPTEVEISSSAGRIKIVRMETDGYEAIITQENGLQFNKVIKIEHYEKENKELGDNIELLNENSSMPNQEQKNISN